MDIIAQIEAYPVLVSIVIFILVIIFGIIGFFIKRWFFSEKKEVKPKLYLVKGPGHSGGPSGFFFSFTLKNVGNSNALDIYWSFEADNLPLIDKIFLVQELSPEATYNSNQLEYGDSKFFKSKLQNPRLIFFYRDIKEKSFQDKISIKQSRRADGNFNIKPAI